jgi:hypothetical protein
MKNEGIYHGRNPLNGNEIKLTDGKTGWIQKKDI